MCPQTRRMMMTTTGMIRQNDGDCSLDGVQGGLKQARPFHYFVWAISTWGSSLLAKASWMFPPCVNLAGIEHTPIVGPLYYSNAHVEL